MSACVGLPRDQIITVYSRSATVYPNSSETWLVSIDIEAKLDQ